MISDGAGWVGMYRLGRRALSKITRTRPEPEVPTATRLFLLSNPELLLDPNKRASWAIVVRTCNSTALSTCSLTLPPRWHHVGWGRQLLHGLLVVDVLVESPAAPGSQAVANTNPEGLMWPDAQPMLPGASVSAPSFYILQHLERPAAAAGAPRWAGTNERW